MMNGLEKTLGEIIREHFTADAQAWLDGTIRSFQQTKDLRPVSIAFVSMPRKTGKGILQLTEEMQQRIQSFRKGFAVQGWTHDRLGRVWLLMHLHGLEQKPYMEGIEKLFLNAEMNELVALYSALPVLDFPEAWRARCMEGIRSNIGTVLEAIMCNNPYPSEQLDEKAWNQLAMKAIFTSKPLHQIQGFRERANAELALILTDFAHERWAAQRTLHPYIWRCVGPFINDRIFKDIERLAASDNEAERDAAALACAESTHPLAQAWLKQNPAIKKSVDEGVVNWPAVVVKAERYLMEKQ